MATVNKDFKIKSGLIVEGTTGTINGNSILTENASDAYIINLIGGETLVTSVSGNLDVTNGDLSINETGLADSLTADSNFLYDNAGTIHLDSEGIYDDLIAGGVATTTNISDAISTEITNRNSAIATAKDEAIFDAGTYTDGEITTALTTAQGYATTAEGNANDYTDTAITNLNLGTTYDAYGSASTAASQALTDANAYTDNAVSDLVGSAPELLDTLQELATALQDNPDVIANIQDVAAGKQDTLTAGNGIEITGDTISVAFDAGNGLAINGTNLTVDTNVIATKTYAQGVADTAEGNANDYTDTAITNLNLGSTYDAYGAAATAEQNAKDYADNLTTDDVAEGNNVYFTEARVNDVLTTSTQTNISITEDVNGHLVFVAENGIADSTTDNLAEGEDNLYFTNTRVIDAVDNADITPKTVQIDTFRKEEATQTYFAAASTATVHSFGYPFGSVKYVVRVVGNVSGTLHSQVTEILATVDGNNNVAVTEFGSIHTTEPALASFTVDYDGGTSQFRLRATTANSGSEVIVAATLLSWAD